MGIQLVRMDKADSRRYIPCIVCDHCEEIIEYFSLGNFYWATETLTAGNRIRSVLFAHKACDTAFDPEKNLVCDELTNFMVYLDTNWRR